MLLERIAMCNPKLIGPVAHNSLHRGIGVYVGSGAENLGRSVQPAHLPVFGCGCGAKVHKSGVYRSGLM